MAVKRHPSSPFEANHPCVSVEAQDIRFALYPPLAFDLALDASEYRLLLPYGAAAIDAGLAQAPSRRIRLRPGDLLLVGPGATLTVRPVDPLEFLIVAVQPERIRRVAETAAGPRWGLRDLMPWHDAAVAVLGAEMRRILLGGLPSAPYLGALADALVTRTVIALAAEVAKAPRDALAPAKLARVLGHIDASLSGPITSAELAAIAELSPAHFSRAFARETGDPPHRFVTKRRICRARDLLSSGEGSIAEIAVRTGFSSQAHLSTAFFRSIGISPARYRAAFRAAERHLAEAPSP